MAELSIEDKGKGKRIITQFFRTMPAVQKILMMVFERDGYAGVFRIQNILYPDNSPEIDSTDTLRKGLSMILQHIYGMPVEDKEGYFQEVVRCKTAAQVVRKEKETLVSYFFANFPQMKQYLTTELVEDKNFQFMSALCQKFISEEEAVADMRGFKNHIRNLSEVLGAPGRSDDEALRILKEYKSHFEEQMKMSASVAAEPTGTKLEGEAGEKQRIILEALNAPKYQGIRDFLIQRTAVDSNFMVFQQYLDNILSSSERVVANNLPTFAAGVEKIKAFRDALEQELAAST